MVGTVQIRSRKAGLSTFDFFEFPLDGLAGRQGGQFANKIRDIFSDLIISDAIVITRPKLKKIATAMAAAGNQEFAQLAPFIQDLIGTPADNHVAIRFNPVDSIGGSNADLKIVPSTAGGTGLKAVRSQANTLIWTKLTKAYFEAKGRKGFFHRTGHLMQDLAAETADLPQRVGPIRVVFLDEKYTGQTNINKGELLGFFRLTYLKSRFFKPDIIPALTPGTAASTVDPKFQLEKMLFGASTATRLGAYAGDATKGSGKFRPRHLVQPALAWFLTERIPTAMARAADRFLRGI